MSTPASGCPRLAQDVINQQIATLSKYGHDALNICHPWSIRRLPEFVRNLAKRYITTLVLVVKCISLTIC